MEMLLDLFPETKRRAARTFTGWSLNAAISCDEAHPGFLRSLTTTSTLRRQAIFGLWPWSPTTEQKPSLLGCVPYPPYRPTVFDPLAVIATVLMTRRERDISRALYGLSRVWSGFSVAWETDPCTPATYRTIVSLLSKPEHRDRAKVLRQMQTVQASTPAVLLALRPPFLLPNLLECFTQVNRLRSSVCH
jgi:hypothetical protein